VTGPSAADGSDIAELEASLRRRFRVTETTVDVGARSLTVLHPANADDLISEEDYVRDERLPYWADIWPSARVLAARIIVANAEGRSLIELGCGAGLVASAAASAGFEVVATDYYDDALLFARVNAYRNSGHEIKTRHLDWRQLPPDGERFDRVVASDVLYEHTYGPLVAEALDRFLSPAGYALMADPGRIARGEFLDSLAPLGLEVVDQEDIAYHDGEVHQTIALIRIERRPG
jgi:ETFB lysine methyltransferase